MDCMTARIAQTATTVDPLLVHNTCVQIVRDWQAAKEGNAPQKALPTGFKTIDAESLLIPLGEVTIVAARPCDGKSSIVFQIADYNIRNGNDTLIVSIEMNADQVINRALAQKTKIPSKVFSDDLCEFERDKLARALKEINDTWKIIRPTDRLVDSICSLIKYECQKKKYKLVIVDHIKMVKNNTIGKSFEKVADTVQQFVDLAQSLHVALLLVAPLRKSAEDGKTRAIPKLADLSQAGEYEAASILFIHRPNPKEAKCSLVVGKNRFGPCGVFEASFQAATQRFVVFEEKEKEEDFSGD
jgi:replicative DNA helicase